MPIVAPTPVTNITTPVPITADPETFDARADLAWTELPVAIDEINDVADNVYENALAVEEIGETIEETAAEVSAAAMVAAEAAGLVGRMTGNLVVGAGAKNIILLEPKPLLALLNKRVAIVQISDPSIKMFGTIGGVTNASVFAVTVVSGGVFGSGTYSEWQIIDAAFYGSAATAAEMWAQTTDAAAISPKTVKDAKVWVNLTDAASVAPNGLNGRNFKWPIGGDRTLAAITNCAVGDVFRIEFTQVTPGGWDIAWASGVYKRVGGLPTLAQTTGQKTHFDIRILAVDGSGTATEALVTSAANPTN